jgi:hypothetical protein
MRVRIIALIAVALTWSAPAQAQSPRSVLGGFGFLGEWSPDCSKPASPSNTRRTATADRRAVRFAEDLGPDHQANEYVVLDARRIARDRIAMRAELNGASVQELTVVKQDGRLRTTANFGSDGKPLVKDGVVVASSRATPWLSKCR